MIKQYTTQGMIQPSAYVDLFPLKWSDFGLLLLLANYKDRESGDGGYQYISG